MCLIGAYEVHVGFIWASFVILGTSLFLGYNKNDWR